MMTMMVMLASWGSWLGSRGSRTRSDGGGRREEGLLASNVDKRRSGGVRQV
jgi:hypothetical protein